MRCMRGAERRPTYMWFNRSGEAWQEKCGQKGGDRVTPAIVAMMPNLDSQEVFRDVVQRETSVSVSDHVQYKQISRANAGQSCAWKAGIRGGNSPEEMESKSVSTKK